MTSKTWVRWVGALVVTGSVMVVGATAAQAHTREAVAMAGRVPLGRGYLDAGHHWIKTCDVRADDRGVRTHYWLANGAHGIVGDANGSPSPCYERAVGTTSNPVVRFQVTAGEDGADTYKSNVVAA
jgi:hypothetical protein